MLYVCLKKNMQRIITIAIRAVFTFVAFLALQYMIPYYYLAPVGLLAGAFLWKTGEDGNLGIGMMMGSVAFGIFAYLYGQV